MHMVCSAHALIYYLSFTNGVLSLCTSSAHSVTLSSVFTVDCRDLYSGNRFVVHTVVPRYNDHLYNGNFDIRRNFIGNESFLIKIYYLITEFTLSDTDGDSRRQSAFLTHFYSLKDRKNHPINCLSAKIFNLP